MAARGFVGAGNLYISRWNTTTGQFDAPVGPYECSKFEIAPKSDIKELSSKGRDTYGQVIESVPLPQPAEFNISLPEVNKESLQLALLGTSTTLNVASGTLSDVSVTCVLQESWYPVGNFQNLEATGLIVENVAGTVTYVKDVDYEVNYALGWIKAKKGGAITAGMTVHVSGTSNARTGYVISGGTNAQLRAKFILEGKNMVDGLPCIVTAHEAILSASSAFDFLADDFNNVEMTGKLKTPTGKTEPFTVEMRDVAGD